jgi:hypothetical protein
MWGVMGVMGEEEFEEDGTLLQTNNSTDAASMK